MKKICLIFLLFLCSITLVYSIGAPESGTIGHEPAVGSGFSGSILLFLIIFVSFMLIFSITNKGKYNNIVLKLENFTYNDNDNEFLKIIGYTSTGIFGKKYFTSFICNKQVLRLESLGIIHNIPLRNITSVSYGINKSNLLLIIGIICFVIGIIGVNIHIIVTLICLMISVLLIIFNFKNKNISIEIFVGENKPIISIKMNGNIDVDKFKFASEALNKVILEV